MGFTTGTPLFMGYNVLCKKGHDVSTELYSIRLDVYFDWWKYYLGVTWHLRTAICRQSGMVLWHLVSCCLESYPMFMMSAAWLDACVIRFSLQAIQQMLLLTCSLLNFTSRG